MAPGRARSFAFLGWPDASSAMWNALVDNARRGELPNSPVEIVGADRDAGAIAAARANAERAGVAGDIVFVRQSISALSHGDPPGLVVVNPPYGIRVGDAEPLKNLYAQLGNVMRERRSGWRLAMLSADRALERQTRLPLEERFHTRNGGIPVRFVTAAPAESTP
jgi:putative N6-adenine-specific DNA methylase